MQLAKTKFAMSILNKFEYCGTSLVSDHVTYYVTGKEIHSINKENCLNTYGQ